MNESKWILQELNINFCLLRVSSSKLGRISQPIWFNENHEDSNWSAMLVLYGRVSEELERRRSRCLLYFAEVMPFCSEIIYVDLKAKDPNMIKN